MEEALNYKIRDREGWGVEIMPGVTACGGKTSFRPMTQVPDDSTDVFDISHEISILMSSLDALERSNTLLTEELTEDPDPEYTCIINENTAVILRRRSRLRVVLRRLYEVDDVMFRALVFERPRSFLIQLGLDDIAPAAGDYPAPKYAVDDDAALRDGADSDAENPADTTDPSTAAARAAAEPQITSIEEAADELSRIQQRIAASTRSDLARNPTSDSGGPPGIWV